MTSVIRPVSLSTLSLVLPDEGVKHISMSGSGVFVCTSKYVRMFDVADERAHFGFRLDEGKFKGVDFCFLEAIKATHRHVAIGATANGSVCLINNQGLCELFRFENPYGMTRIAMNKLAIASQHWITQVDIETRMEYGEVHVTEAELSHVSCMQQHGANEIITGCHRGPGDDGPVVSIWDFRQKKMCWSAQQEHHTSVDVVHSTSTYVIGADATSVAIWDIRKSGSENNSLLTKLNRVNDTTCICPNGLTEFTAATAHQRIYHFMDITSPRNHVYSVIRRRACIPRRMGIHENIMYIICESKPEVVPCTWSPIVTLPPLV
jgi:hypothetical protein